MRLNLGEFRLLPAYRRSGEQVDEPVSTTHTSTVPA
jgi:hypothetical protein